MRPVPVDLAAEIARIIAQADPEQPLELGQFAELSDLILGLNRRELIRQLLLMPPKLAKERLRNRDLVPQLNALIVLTAMLIQNLELIIKEEVKAHSAPLLAQADRILDFHADLLSAAFNSRPPQERRRLARDLVYKLLRMRSE